MENNPKLLVPNCYPSSTLAMHEAIAGLNCHGVDPVTSGLLTLRRAADLPGLRDNLSWFPDVMEARLVTGEIYGAAGPMAYLSVEPDELIVDAVSTAMGALVAHGYDCNIDGAIPVHRYQTSINILADAACLLAFAAHVYALRIDNRLEDDPASVQGRLILARIKRDKAVRELAALEAEASPAIAQAAAEYLAGAGDVF